MTNIISSKPGNKPCAENIKLRDLEGLDGADNLDTDSTCEPELTFSMDNINLFNQVVEKLISALDSLENEKQRIPLKIMRERE